jgi:glycosyltransferase involved in cell wall biosynthesis
VLSTNKSYPKITIITATYNSADTVVDTLKSIAGQTYPNIEHIIVDGLSKDNTLAVVRSFPHVSKVISEKDKGIYDAMNKGIALATGDIIGILNSDDFYTSNAVISNVVDHFAAHKTDSIYANLYFVDENNTEKIQRTWKSKSFDRRNFYLGWMPPHPTFFVKKEVYEKLGGFNTALKSAADYELMLRFLFINHVSTCYLPEFIVKMRNGGQSTASLKNRLFANREDKMAWKLNHIKPYFFTIWLKPLRKISQFRYFS